MILTQQHIRNLLSNHDIVKVLPEMLSLVEELKALQKNLENSGCRSCQMRSRIEPVLLRGHQALVALSSEKVSILKTFLGLSSSSRLLAYVPQTNGKPGLVELGK